MQSTHWTGGLLHLVDDLAALAGVGVDPVYPVVVPLQFEVLRPAAVAAKPAPPLGGAVHHDDSTRPRATCWQLKSEWEATSAAPENQPVCRQDYITTIIARSYEATLSAMGIAHGNRASASRCERWATLSGAIRGGGVLVKSLSANWG